MRYLPFLLPCLVLAGTACQRVDHSSSTPLVGAVTAMTPDAPLRDTRWVLRQVAGQPVAAPEAATTPAPYLFISAAGTAEGLGGCNHFRGGLELADTDGQLQFARLASTRIACPTMAVEQQFSQALNTTRYYRITGDTLRLYGDAERSGTPLAQLVATTMP